MTLKKVLIIDDDQEILEFVGRKLEREGYIVSPLSKTRNIVTDVRNFMPDLILLDIVLPDVDGPEAARMLREDPLTRPIPIIFLSGIIEKKEDGESAGIRIGDKKYESLSKPFTAQQLLDKIQEVLGE